MPKALKAALLSGLVFPGLGYFVVKRPLRALVVMAISAVCLAYLIDLAVQQASTLMDKLMSGEVAPDVASVQQLLTNSSAASDSTWSTIATFVLLACWLFSIVDGYRTGNKEEPGAPRDAAE
ncbi:hypothetical protein VVD49_17080 [Uliginosibacterium sp. H3]|uniref:DUF5683 domain-containing protein n=1 Tax=Uliginosibacterium silvisoli TaxID=3114758 RepID=A0ABU6K728_9RHOO|nr:hypothetical protein [Uliginosibacterium sp. H3]